MFAGLQAVASIGVLYLILLAGPGDLMRGITRQG